MKNTVKKEEKRLVLKKGTIQILNGLETLALQHLMGGSNGNPAGSFTETPVYC